MGIILENGQALLMDTSFNSRGCPLTRELTVQESGHEFSPRVSAFLLPGRGVGSTHQSFIWGGFAPRSKPLPFYISILTEKVPLSDTFHRKLYPFHVPTERLLLNFSYENLLKYLDDSAVRCVCSRYFESPFKYPNDSFPSPFLYINS